jgi:hypothetical protein
MEFNSNQFFEDVFGSGRQLATILFGWVCFKQKRAEAAAIWRL